MIEPFAEPIEPGESHDIICCASCENDRWAILTDGRLACDSCGECMPIEAVMLTLASGPEILN